jgi:NAD(P)H-hydrate repair Nnr-like enzyme with NAD(P)H-hydrate dehydratase domain
MWHPTAGSGDVLTGMITVCWPNLYEPVNAAIMGVYLHGLTADIAIPETGTPLSLRILFRISEEHFVTLDNRSK